MSIYRTLIHRKARTPERLRELWEAAERQIGADAQAFVIFMDPHEIQALVEYVWELEGVPHA
jgi:hypothetical protein